MHIGLNGQRIVTSAPAGPEVYTINIYKAIAEVDKTNTYTVYFNSKPTIEFWNDLSNNNPNFSYKVLKSKWSWTQVGLAKELLLNPVDVFFSPVHTLPAVHHPRTKMVSMLHGLEYKINNQFHNSWIKAAVHPFIIWWILTMSKIVVVPSVATKKAVIDLNWPFVNKHKLTIISEGVSKDYYKRSNDEIKSIRQKYQINNSPYLLFVSTIQPRKNIPRMIEAFSNLLKDGKVPDTTKLIISGKDGWMIEESRAAPLKFSVEKNVLFVGRTPDADLPALLSGAEAFISCSLEEGFGLPLLEAMACETPTIVSNIPAFNELTQEYTVYVNPSDVNSIASGIIQVLSGQYNKENIAQAKKRAQLYTWENAAKELVRVFSTTTHP